MKTPYTNDISVQTDTATFGMGCFWCTEAVFMSLEGVISVTPGYSGGHTPNPTYNDVCSGITGHAEVAQIVFDPARISFQGLLDVFWSLHDPTQLNRQGADIGSQYRSAIFYHSDEQRDQAISVRQKLTEEKVFSSPIVTEIVPFVKFYKSEDYHQDYYSNNPNAPYCRFVIDPKIDKVKKLFNDKIKK